MEMLIKKWKEAGVEEENIQRFAARILGQLKHVDVLVGVDTAIFKKEIGYVRLLEVEISSMDSRRSSDRSKLKERTNELVSLVIDTDKVPLDQTREGTAWTLRTNMSTSDIPG